MDLKRLTYFCAIVEQGQISRAARFLNISQPPLSQRLNELEDELGAQLILREGHQWHVTEIGAIVYREARQILDRLGGLAAVVKDLAEGSSGTLCIGASSTCTSYFHGILPEARRRFPRLRYRLRVCDSTELSKLVRNRELDLALVLLPIDAQGLRIHPLPDSDFSVVFPKALTPSGMGPKARVQDLAGLPLICSRRWTSGGTYDKFLEAFQSNGIAPDIVMDTPDSWTGLRALEGIEAAAIFPTREIPVRLFPNHLVLPLDLPEMDLHPALIHLEDRIFSTSCRQIMEMILSHGSRPSSV